LFQISNTADIIDSNNTMTTTGLTSIALWTQLNNQLQSFTVKYPIVVIKNVIRAIIERLIAKYAVNNSQKFIGIYLVNNIFILIIHTTMSK